MNLRQQRDRYVASLRASGRSPKTVRCYEERIGQLINYLSQTFYPLQSTADIRLDHIQQYHDHLIDKNLSVSTRRTYLATIRGFLEWHQRHSPTPSASAWLNQIEVPKRTHRLPPTALSKEEIRSLIAVNPSPRNRAILAVMYACGLRRSEVVSINIGDLCIPRQQLLVHGKGSKDRVVPIASPAIRIVQAYLDTRGDSLSATAPLFVAEPPRSPNRLTTNYLATLFRRMPNPTGRHVHPHLLRHTFAVHLLRGGADVRHVQALLGHASPDTTNQYLGLVKGEMKLAYDRAMRTILRPGQAAQHPIQSAA